LFRIPLAEIGGGEIIFIVGKGDRFAEKLPDIPISFRFLLAWFIFFPWEFLREGRSQENIFFQSLIHLYKTLVL